jgi:uncharacterized repeat protein (TIGR03803 family)
MRVESTFAKRCLLTFAMAFGVAAIISQEAHGQTFSVMYSFTGGKDGANPLAGVVAASGNLYGTASSGGASGAGLVYKINASGTQSVVYSFTGGTDGADPESGLLLLGGNLYGTTAAGGTFGAGTVFEVTQKGKETVLHSFTGGVDGADPQGTLVKDSSGNLYGTTFSGGASGGGTIFKLVRPTTIGGAWTEEVLHSFGAGTDGADPVAGVTLDKAGNLYGTTSAGGIYGYDTVFQLVPSTSGWTENILHHFQLQSDGGTPYAGVILDGSNRLYGAATDGGQGGSNGGGTVFELTHSSSGWAFAVLYSLPGWGIAGSFRNLLLASGKIYATTHCDGANSAGTVYELTHAGEVWMYTSLYVFTGGSDGLFSFSNLVFDKLGNLYGTTKQGGENGYGVVFKITP